MPSQHPITHHPFYRIMSTFGEQFAAVIKSELNRVYSNLSPKWRPLTLRTDSPIGRKRRARRARGRQIKARLDPPYVGGRIYTAGVVA